MRNLMSALRRNERPLSLGALVLAAALPVACAGLQMPPSSSSNPFIGAWANPERDQIDFRADTVVLHPNSAPTAMSAATCSGRFRFGYGRKSREELNALAPRQSDVRAKLAGLLSQPVYPVAELGCDQGSTTYVLVDDHHLVAIYRDGDIASLERLSRL